MMEWSEIKDPENVFVFSRLVWEAVRDSWTPEEIQEMINVDGVMGMVHKVNEYYSKEAKQRKPIRLGHISGQKAVLARDEDNS
jgi:hypothetical protein